MIKIYPSAPATPAPPLPATKDEVAALLETARASIEAKVVTETAKVAPPK